MESNGLWMNYIDMDPIELSIIIVNWNGKKWLKECLDSIHKQTFKNFELILVDNGSNDGSVRFIKENYPETVVIENKENIGFGKANNIGAQSAKGKILFLLNNDTIIEDEKFFEKMIRAKKERDLHITGPRILDFEKKDIYKGRRLSIDCTGYLGWAGKTFYIEGCAMFVDRDLFWELEGFDKTNFAYSEDIDLCWRAHLLGKKIDICPGVSIIHFGGGTSETTQLKDQVRHAVPTFRKYEVEKNNLRNLLKNYRLINIIWTVPLHLLLLVSESIVYILSGNWKIIKYIVRSVIWNISNIRDTIKEREKIQKKRTIGDGEIFKMMSFGINKPRAFLIIGLPKFK